MQLLLHTYTASIVYSLASLLLIAANGIAPSSSTDALGVASGSEQVTTEKAGGEAGTLLYFCQSQRELMKL